MEDAAGPREGPAAPLGTRGHKGGDGPARPPGTAGVERPGRWMCVRVALVCMWNRGQSAFSGLHSEGRAGSVRECEVTAKDTHGKASRCRDLCHGVTEWFLCSCKSTFLLKEGGEGRGSKSSKAAAGKSTALSCAAS